MKAVPITEGLSVSGQPDLGESAALAESGVALLIDDRPDRQEPAQPGTQAEAAAAGRAGLGYLHLPGKGAAITRADAARFRKVVPSASGPVAAQCRSGTRSSTPRTIGEAFAGNLAHHGLLDHGARNGFDHAGAVRWLKANAEP